MKLLFLGGTQFVGRHMVAAALSAGHEVTLFNRGTTNSDLFPEVEKLRGDRDTDLSALAGRTWDAVIDVNAYIPRWVTETATLLRDAVKTYVFVSTVSVYQYDQLGPGADESAPVQRLADPTVEQVTGQTYGGLKVLCEEAAESIMPGRVLTLRLGIVAGPYDPTDRVTYYVQRLAHGGNVLVPALPEMPVQFIDARDLAAFLLTALDRGLTGIYNTTGHSVSWKQFLDACAAAAGTKATYTYVDSLTFFQEYVDRETMRPYGAVPMSVPPAVADVYRVSSARALGAGLVIRPLVDTARDVLAWERSRDPAEPRQAGMSREQEADLLARWSDWLDESS